MLDATVCNLRFPSLLNGPANNTGFAAAKAVRRNRWQHRGTNCPMFRFLPLAIPTAGNLCAHVHSLEGPDKGEGTGVQGNIHEGGGRGSRGERNEEAMGSSALSKTPPPTYRLRLYRGEQMPQDPSRQFAVCPSSNPSGDNMTKAVGRGRKRGEGRF